MFFIIAFCIIVVFFGCLASSGKMKHGLEAAFLLIILFSAFRYNYGNDYSAYYERFHNIAKITSFHALLNLFDGPFDKYEGAEMGWTLLNWFFRPLGFEVLVICTSIFTSIIYYKFIKTFVPQKWYWLALFTYIFNTSLFFVPLSMMRQSLGMALFVLSFKYIYNKKVIPTVLLILVAALFHKSAILLLPFALFGYLERVSGKILAIFVGFVFIALLFADDLTATLVESALTFESLESYGEYFENPEFEAAGSFGLGFATSLITFFIPFLFLYSDKKQVFSTRLVVLIASLSFLIAPFTQILGFIGRISYYFMIYNIVAYPLIYNWMKNRLLKYGLLALYIAYVLYAYLLFFRDPNWVYFTHYQTIFG
jgi:hypothetical protein